MRETISIFSLSHWVIRLLFFLLIGGTDTCFNFAETTYAQVTTSITPTSGTGNLNTTVTQSGSLYNITNGTRAGTNLFHSFENFSVGAGNTANFLNNTSLQTTNILGRVTGGNVSNIYGTLQTTGFGNANLFLMNPAGIVFGPNATLNVGGSVTFTTANYLRLADTGIFHADLAATSVLTSAPVVSFGFLGSNAGAITVQGSQLSVADGMNISLVGGNVTIQSGTPEGGTTQPAQLSAPNGNILLASAASPGEFLVAGLQSAPNINGDSFTSYSSVQLASGSLLDVSGTGKVSIRSGSFVLEAKEAILSTEATPSVPGGGTQDTVSLSRGSTLVTATTGNEAGADVQIVGKSVQLDGASITSLSTGAGRGGAITVTAEDSVSLTGGAQLVSRTEGAGEGGNIAVEATSPTGSITISGFDLDGTVSGVATPFLFNPMTGNPLVASGIYSLTSGSKPGGNISITAPTVSLQDGAVVATVTSGDAAGGNVSINSGTFELVGGASLLSFAGQDFTAPDFEFRGTGSGGNLLVSATDSVTVSGGNLDLFMRSNIFSATVNPNQNIDPILGQGQGGSITVSAPSIILDNAGTIVSSTQGRGTGGGINLEASSSLSVSGFSQDFGMGSSIITSTSGFPGGNGGAILISGPSVTVENGGYISTNNSSSAGNGGNLAVTAGDLTLRNGGSITSSASGDGSSGQIQITARGTLSISGQFFDPNNPGSGWSVIRNTADGESSLNGGIDIHVGKLVMKDGPQYALNQDVGQIQSDTGSSAGGTIRIIADDSISMSNGANILNQKGSFESGSISLEAPSISLDKSVIRGRTNIDRNAGAISLNATHGDLTLSNDSHILTSTQFGSGNAGPIVVKATGTVSLSGGSTIESNSSSVATGNGGTVSVTADNQLSISGPQTGVFSTTAGTGNGGTITVQAPQIQIRDGAVVSAKSTGSGAAGTVTIEGPNSPANSVVIDGVGTGIFTNTQGSGAGGDITVDTKTLTIQNGGTISSATSGQNAAAVGGDITVTATQSVDLRNNASLSASSTGLADAGNISINAGKRFTAQNSSVTTKSDNAGGGNIEINATDQIRLVNSQINASAYLDGGNISIDPNLVILQNSQILAQAIQGAGGNITITTPLFLADFNSLVSASSQFGLNGTVTIQSPTSNLSGSLGTLASKPRQAQSLLTQRCAALADGQTSSFVVAGREQLPADPGGWLSSPLAFAGIDVEWFGDGTVAEGTSHLEPRASGLLATDRVSLRRLTPAGFLIASFAESEATGCHS